MSLTFHVSSCMPFLFPAAPLSKLDINSFGIHLFFRSVVVKDYIQEAKTHMSQTCQDMEAGLRLTSHYVDVKVSRRETFFRCGKNTNKFLDKELIIMGDTDRQKSLMGQSQVKLLLDINIIIMLSCVSFEHCNSIP